MDMYSINKNLVGYQAAKIKIKIKKIATFGSSYRNNQYPLEP